MDIMNSIPSWMDRKTLTMALIGAGTVSVIGGCFAIDFLIKLSNAASLRRDKKVVQSYTDRMALRMSPILKQLRERSEQEKDCRMLSSADAGQLLGNLIRMMGAKSVIEVGVYTGCGTLAMAEALPENGKVIACDISDVKPSIGKPFWDQAGVTSKIDLRIAPGADTLQGLIDEGRQESFDLAFIDADKDNYCTYYELCLELIRPGGVIAVDNVFMFGTAHTANPSPRAEGIAKLNRKIKTDDRVNVSMLNIGDGLSICVKK